MKRFFLAITILMVFLVACAPAAIPTPATKPPVVIQQPPIATSTAAPVAAPPTATPTPITIIYVVVAGDTVSKIAQKFGVSVDDIVKANKLADPSKIQVGQRLTISTTSSPAPIPANVAPPPPPTPTPKPSVPTATPTANPNDWPAGKDNRMDYEVGISGNRMVLSRIVQDYSLKTNRLENITVVCSYTKT